MPAPLCDQLPRLAAEPSLDGTLPASLVPVPVEVGGWKGTGDGPPDEIFAEAAIGWWEDGLSIFIDVTDPDRFPAPPSTETWCGDRADGGQRVHYGHAIPYVCHAPQIPDDRELWHDHPARVNAEAVGLREAAALVAA